MVPDELIGNLPELRRKPENLLKALFRLIKQALLYCCRKISESLLGLREVFGFSHRLCSAYCEGVWFFALSLASCISYAFSLSEGGILSQAFLTMTT